MATLTNKPNGSRFIQWADAQGKRSTLHLGPGNAKTPDLPTFSQTTVPPRGAEHSDDSGADLQAAHDALRQALRRERRRLARQSEEDLEQLAQAIREARGEE